MIKLLGLFLAHVFFFGSFNGTPLNEVRATYTKVVSDKDLCHNMISDLQNIRPKSSIHRAYLGGLQTIWANHVFSPISKLNTFKKGKKNIEQAIENDPKNVEIRFIRLSVQKNTPSFLGYKSNIKEDTAFIKENGDQIESDILQKNMEKLLEN